MFIGIYVQQISGERLAVYRTIGPLVYEIYANSIAPDVTPQNAESHMIWGYSVCLEEFHKKNRIKF